MDALADVIDRAHVEALTEPTIVHPGMLFDLGSQDNLPTLEFAGKR